MSTVLDFRKRTAKAGSPAADSLRATGKFAVSKLPPDFRIVFIDTLMVSQPTAMGLHHTPMLMAIGLNEGGEHALLGGSMISGSLSEAWQRLMDQMRLAGLRNMKLVVSSAPNDLKLATLRAFPRAQWQRPAGVLHSRLMEKVPAPHRRTLRAYLSAMYTRNELLEAEIVAAKILNTLTNLGLWDAAVEFSAGYPDTLTCFTMPKPMRRQVFDDKAFGALIDGFIHSATQSGQFRGCSVTRLRFDELIAESELHSPLTTLPAGAVDPDKTLFESDALDMPPLLEITYSPTTAMAAPVPAPILPDLLDTTADPVVRRATLKSTSPEAGSALQSAPQAKPEIKPTVNATVAKPSASTPQTKSSTAPTTTAPAAKTNTAAKAAAVKPTVKPPAPRAEAKTAAAATSTASTTSEKREAQIAAKAAATVAKSPAAAVQSHATPATAEVRRVEEPKSAVERTKAAPVAKPPAQRAPLKAETVSPTTSSIETAKAEVKPTETSPTPKQPSGQSAPRSVSREVTQVSHAAPQPPAVTSLLDLDGAIDIESSATYSSRAASDLELPPIEDLQPFGTPWEADDNLADLAAPDFSDRPTLRLRATDRISFETRLELEALENFVKASQVEREQEETAKINAPVAEPAAQLKTQEPKDDVENATAVEIIEMPMPAGPVFPANDDPSTIPVQAPQRAKVVPRKPAKSSRWRYAGATAAAIAINTVLFGLAVALLAPHGKAQLQASVSQFVHFIDAPATDAARNQTLTSSHDNASSGSSSETEATMGISEANRKLVAGGDAQPPALSMAAPELPVPTVKLTRTPDANPTPARKEHAEAKAPDAIVTKPLATPTTAPGVSNQAPNSAAPAAGNGDGLGTGSGISSGAQAGKPAAAPVIEVNVEPQFRQPPAYPPKALMDGIEGEVTLEFNILDDGTVRDARVVEAVPSGVFDTAALSAIALWRYAPKTIDGQRVARRARQSMLFTLRH